MDYVWWLLEQGCQLLKGSDSLYRVIEDVPIVRLRLGHTSGGNEFGYEGGQESMGVEELEAFCRAIWCQNRVEFVVDALGCDLGE